MQDYVQLYRKKKRVSYKRQIEAIRAMIVSGRSPVQIVLCISILLLSVRR